MFNNSNNQYINSLFAEDTPTTVTTTLNHNGNGNNRVIIGRINGILGGPLVEANQMDGASINEVVKIGKNQILGEILKIDGEKVIIQVYESLMGTVHIDDTVECTGEPLMMELGPGLVSCIFDGIQRPLEAILNTTQSPYLKYNGNLFHHIKPLNRETVWEYQPNLGVLAIGRLLSPGDIFGVVQETDMIQHRLMVPHGKMGTIIWFEDHIGNYTVDKELVKLRFQDGTIHTLTMIQRWPIKKARPVLGDRLPFTTPLLTGCRILDTLFPCPQGGSSTIPGSFGLGKSSILFSIARYSNTDLTVMVMCGERGNEAAEFLMTASDLVTPDTHLPLINKMIVIANTSDMPVAAREASIYMGITVAEYYRDMGYNVSLTADSTSRWAEALKEISTGLGETPGEKGFPIYLPSRIAQFYERGGRATSLGTPERDGSITIVSTISPMSRDYNDPVVQSTFDLVQAFWYLDVKLAQIRHYPSICWLNSFKKGKYGLSSGAGDGHHNLDNALSDHFNNIDQYNDFIDNRTRFHSLLQKEDELKETIQIVGRDQLSEMDKVTLETTKLIREEFLQQNQFTPYDKYCPLYKSAWMMRIILSVHDNAMRALLSTGSSTNKPITSHDIYSYQTQIAELSSLLHKVRTMRFQDPSDGRPALDEHYRTIYNQIHSTFQSIKKLK